MRFLHRTAFVCTLFLIFFASAQIASAATLSISPTSGTFEVGQTVSVKVMVSSNIPINAISGTLYFPSDLFTIQSVSKSGSILNFWVSEPSFSTAAGTAEFEGVTLGGFGGGTGSVVTVVLRAVKTGTGSVAFRSGQVLANDGEGTDVTSSKSGGTFTVVEATAKPKPVEKEPKPEPVEEVQPKPSLNSPEIVKASKYGELAISGTSQYPNAQVLLTFMAPGGEKLIIMDSTDGSGKFLTLVPQTLKHGDYKVYAIVVRGDLSNSPHSNEILISVGNLFSDIGWELRISLLLLILVLLYLIARSYHYMKRNRRLKAAVRKEAEEAETIVHKSFDIMREDVGDSKEIKKDLDQAEKVITKEIRDIEKS